MTTHYLILVHDPHLLITHKIEVLSETTGHRILHEKLRGYYESTRTDEHGRTVYLNTKGIVQGVMLPFPAIGHPLP